MIRKLQHIFALSEQGTKDLVSGVFWCTVCNLSLMAPVGLLFFVLQTMIAALTEGTDPSSGVWGYTLGALIILVFIFLFHWKEYAKTYTGTYEESANRRVRLAETVSYTHLTLPTKA